jgi:predicted nucleic acid-binding protein
VNTFVIDASIAVKWVVEENGTAEALVLRQKAKLIAPELLVAECANILWKKVQRHELLKEEALLAARLLQGVEIELLPTRSLLEAATQMSIEINHPAYDCSYLPWRSTMDAGVLQQMNPFFGNFIRAESTGFVPERFR